MIVRITRPIQGGTIPAIASKSEAHRLLICAALADSETFISCAERSEDIDATERCLKALGAELKYENKGFFVRPIDRTLIQSERASEAVVLDCGESGATLRFLLPICGALGLPVSFNMKGCLSERPLSALRDEMISHGCTLSEPGLSPLNCKGRLKSGTYTLPGNISSQFVSGLLFALPLLEGDSIVTVIGTLESRPYVDMTLDALSLFGINIAEEEKQVFLICGQAGTKKRAPIKTRAGGDWSNAAFWLSAGAIGGNGVACAGLDLDSRQGDRAIIEYLSRFGAKVNIKNDAVNVSPGTLRGIEIDAGDTPDLVPIVAAAASVADGVTVIRNARRLRIKESDRLRTVAALLTDLGADARETDDGLVITGKKILTGGETRSFGDHRIAMTAAVMSAVCAGAVTIHGADAVRKSYPDFFKDFNALGGQYEHIR